ncbi:peptidoglycan DD-metalloendopeptidase family protein [Deinococcus altitudinis]|uniref:peptidoglycan DD-metalloendopeptidase family protein n=1 Tax=Deinococcus altitudinis TaxID=468914 RepID=UPI003891AA0F
MIRIFPSGPARTFLLLSLGLLVCPAAQALSPLLERALPSVVLQASGPDDDRIQVASGGAQGVSLPVQDSAAVLVLARAGDTGQDIADSYGVDVSALSPRQPGKLPWGAVVRVSLQDAVQTGGQNGAGQLPPGVGTYVVRPGDTLASVAYRHDLSVTELLSANLSRQTLDKLAVGDQLYVPSQPGLMVRIKPGQTVQGLVKTYRADAARVAKANGIGLPNELGVGDYLLLPGVLATGFQQELLARRGRQAEAEKQARVQQQYEKYQAYAEEVKENRLRQTYAAQAQYEKFLAYQKSPARQKLIARYEAQARYEAAQQAQQQQARAQASVPSSAPSVRSASSASLDGGLSWPLRSYRITSRFGEADIEFHKQYFHGGVDLAAPYGTPIYAAAAGTITESGNGDFGNDVYTDTGDALIIYGHMSRTAVSVGQHVSRGDVLGYVGCSGMCTGPHLHFEIRLSGQPVDPLGLLP